MPQQSLEEYAGHAKQGSSVAISAVIAEMLPTIRREASKLVHPGLDFDDAVQEGLIGLLRAIQTFDENKEASFKTYATICVRNAVLSANRKARAKKHGPLNESLPMNDEFEAYGPEDLAIQEEQYQAAITNINTLLSPFEKKVLQLYMEGKSYNEIAQVCGKTSRAVDNAMQRLRRKLMRQ